MNRFKKQTRLLFTPIDIIVARPGFLIGGGGPVKDSIELVLLPQARYY